MYSQAGYLCSVEEELLEDDGMDKPTRAGTAMGRNCDLLKPIIFSPMVG